MSDATGAPPAADAAKAAVGRAAAALVESGMRVGLGTGSTAVHAVRAIAERTRRGTLRDLALVPTSTQTQTDCWELGLNLVTLNDPVVAGRLDLTIDGADEVDPAWDLIKGGGGALLNEKVVAAVSSRYAIVVDESKLVPRLGSRCPVPVEVVPLALAPVRAALQQRGFRTAVRIAVRKQGPVITDHGNLIIDAWPPAEFDAVRSEADLAAIPGVVENGLFTGCVTDLLVGGGGGVRHQRRDP
jgi:ribose 5-phosphate isomerase A